MTSTAQHHLDSLPPRAKVVVTDDVKAVRAHVHDVVRNGGVVLVDGMPGTSKTLATACAVSDLPCPVYWMELHNGARIADLVRQMTENLPEGAGDLDDCCVVVDEAQHLDAPMIGVLQGRLGPRRPGVALVLVGWGAGSVAHGHPELNGWVRHRVQTEEFPTHERREVLSRFHRLLARTDDDTLAFLARFAKGNLRLWSFVVREALEMGIPAARGISADQAPQVLEAVGRAVRSGFGRRGN